MFGSYKKNWIRISKLGRNKYIFFFGVLGWGLPVAILFALQQGFFNDITTSWPELILAFTIFPIGGVFWGYFMWKLLMRKVVKFEAENPDLAS
jgi:hypothetical protein